MKFEIINPSDKCYIHGDAEADAEALCLVTLALGGGNYMLEDEEGSLLLPAFIFGGAEEWWISRFGRTIDDSRCDIDTIKRSARIFESFEYAGERTSMTDIGMNARLNGKLHREFLQKENAKG
jgi:hypothetical protein